MLRIWSAMSGKELASIPAEKVDDVRALKLLLHSEHGLPARFRQRLVYLNSVSDGVLDDFVKLDSPMDLQLVLIPYVQSSQIDADKLTAAAAEGSLSEVGLSHPLSKAASLSPPTPSPLTIAWVLEAPGRVRTVREGKASR